MKRIRFSKDKSFFQDIKEPLRDRFVNPDNNKDLLKYFQEIRNKFLYTTNLGIALDDNDSGSMGKPVLLSSLFVPPLLSNRPISLEESVVIEKKRKDVELQEIYQTLKIHPRLFVLGVPGTGKTTLVQWLVLSLTYSGDNHVKGALGNLIPFALILRNLSISKVNSWSELWQTYLETTGISITQQLTELLLETGQALFLIDGLDEISDPNLRKNLGRVIHEGMNRYNRCRFVITSRIVGFSLVEFFNFDSIEDNSDTLVDDKENQSFNFPQLMQERLMIAYLAPFDKRQVRSFVNNWYKQYEINTSIQSERVEDLVVRIEQNDGLGQLSRIPVLLNMICFIHARRARLPDGRAELYERIAETYLVSLDRARGIGFLGKDINIDYLDLSNWLAKIALKMQYRRGTRNDNVFTSREEIENVLKNGLQEKGVGERKCEAQCQFILNYIINRSGFLVPIGRKDGQEVFAFSHLSFQEYFAARALDEEILFVKNEMDWKKLRKLLDKSHWNETFVIFFELQPSVKKADILAEALFEKGPENRNKYFSFNENDNFNFDKFLNKEDPSLNRWLVASNISMDTSVRLGVEKRKCLIEKSWQMVLQIMQKAKELISYTWIADRLLIDTLPAILFHNQFGSLDIFVKLASNVENLRLMNIQSMYISVLTKLTKLKQLQLSCHSEVNISVLSDLKDLEYLYITKTPLSEINWIGNLTKLRYLSLVDTPITSIDNLSNVTKLYLLNISDSPVSDLGSISNCKELGILEIANTKVNDISCISSLENLMMLDLTGTSVSDFSVISKMNNLTALRLRNTGFNDTNLLSSLKSLITLDMRETRICEVDGLSDLYHLVSLDVSFTSVENINSLFSLNRLTSLFLRNTKVEDISVVTNFTNLRYLWLDHTNVTDISVLSKLKKLRYVSIDGSPVKNLECLSGNTRITIHGIPKKNE